MKVLIDTTVWSLALRRQKRSHSDEIIVQKLSDLILEGRAKLIGPIHQELLSGVESKKSFDLLNSRLSVFEYIEIQSIDYVRAAEMYNTCRKKGIQGSHIDYLICAVAEKNHISIFTLDKDFLLYAKHLPIILY